METYAKYLPSGLIFAFTIKQLAFGTSLSEMGVTFSFAALVALQTYLEKSKKIQEVLTQADVKHKEVTEVVNKQNEVIEKMAREIALLRDSVAGVKLSSGLMNKKFGT